MATAPGREGVALEETIVVNEALRLRAMASAEMGNVGEDGTGAGKELGSSGLDEAQAI